VAGEWGRGASPGRQLIADWGSEVERVRERGGKNLGQDCLGGFPSLVSTSYRTRRIREGEIRVAG
jgi:hypothetical protein